ncbi:MAG: hypothetical protein LBG19_02635 [Prevotellaceae bacterium]|jgi:hypothetical protein|nr:hypothetical protein [Prevotellaceae bacterium]
MKKLSLKNLTLNSRDALLDDEKKKVTGGNVPYTYECFNRGGPKSIRVWIRVGIDPEPC